MSVDTQLQHDVLDALAHEPALHSGEIAVSAREGIVTLSGLVDTYIERCAAVRTAHGVPGVTAVADELAVRVPSAFGSFDTQIAHAAVDAIARERRVRGTIRFTVQQGWLTLEGSVDEPAQRVAAERAVRTVAGVAGVSNRIEVGTLVANGAAASGAVGGGGAGAGAVRSGAVPSV